MRFPIENCTPRSVDQLIFTGTIGNSHAKPQFPADKLDTIKKQRAKKMHFFITVYVCSIIFNESYLMFTSTLQMYIKSFIVC